MGRLEGETPRRGRQPKADPQTSDFAAIVEAWKAERPEEYEECRRWPTESGLIYIANKLKA